MDYPIDMQERDQRYIALEGCYNMRDIGGYPTLDGRTTRWKTLFRSDSLHCLSADDQQVLLDHGVQTIIDLRRAKEAIKAPNILARSSSVTYKNIPLIETVQIARPTQSLLDRYCFLLESCQEQIKLILAMMAEGNIFPCIIHCTAGKDRTGLLIALLLSISNVSPATIANDYALSEPYLTPFFKTFRSLTKPDGYNNQRYAWLTRAPAETMLATLAYLNEQYGGVKEYLTAIGISQQQLTDLCAQLVE